MRDVVNATVGLLGGLLLSTAFWYFITHRLVPKIAFGEKISVLATAEGKVYRIKLANVGTRRGVLDVAHPTQHKPGWADRSKSDSFWPSRSARAIGQS
jgi:hypothetical protein